MNKEVRILADDLFNRHFVGFDRLFDHFTNVNTNSYPPHNVVKTGEETRDIEFALAGFTEDDIEITVENEILTVSGVQQADDENVFDAVIGNEIQISLSVTGLHIGQSMPFFGQRSQ